MANDSYIGKKAATYLTTNAIEVERWLGAGIKYAINLNEK